MCVAYVWAVLVILWCGQGYAMVTHQDLSVPQRTGCFDLEFRVVQGNALGTLAALPAQVLPWPQSVVCDKVLEIQSRRRDANDKPLMYARLFYAQGHVQLSQFWGLDCFQYQPFTGDKSWQAYQGFKPYMLAFIKAYQEFGEQDAASKGLAIVWADGKWSLVKS